MIQYIHYFTLLLFILMSIHTNTLNTSIHNIYPLKTISVNHSTDTINHKDILYKYQMNKDTKIVGLSRYSTYQSGLIIPVTLTYDYSDTYITGHMPENTNEITVSSIYSQYYNKTLYIHYKYKNKIKGYKVKVVGVYKSDYQSYMGYPDSQFLHLQSLFHQSFSKDYGILYYKKPILKELQDLYPYTFTYTGQSKKLERLILYTVLYNCLILLYFITNHHTSLKKLIVILTFSLLSYVCLMIFIKYRNTSLLYPFPILTINTKVLLTYEIMLVLSYFSSCIGIEETIKL